MVKIHIIELQQEVDEHNAREEQRRRRIEAYNHFFASFASAEERFRLAKRNIEQLKVDWQKEGF